MGYKSRRPAFTLVELMLVVATVTLLLSILVPSIYGARRAAQQIQCKAQMRAINAALLSYGAMNAQLMPPFAFSAIQGNIAVSGHWGGPTMAGQPAQVCTNLWALVQSGLLDAAALRCTAVAGQVNDKGASYFASTRQFSTYCLRMPPSVEMFRFSPGLSPYNGRTLGIFVAAAGGQIVNNTQRVPVLRMDQDYRLDSSFGQRTYNFATSAILSDEFWYQDYSADAGGAAKYPVRWKWCHGSTFNVLSGNGAIREVKDTANTVANNTASSGNTPADDGQYYATYAEKVWAFFEAGGQ